MYRKLAVKKKFELVLIHANQNDHGGYRNLTFELAGKGAYGLLKNESGVHRLVRISPFNAKKLRHTSFSLVEVLPKFSKLEEKESSRLLRIEEELRKRVIGQEEAIISIAAPIQTMKTFGCSPAWSNGMFRLRKRSLLLPVAGKTGDYSVNRRGPASAP